MELYKQFKNDNYKVTDWFWYGACIWAHCDTNQKYDSFKIFKYYTEKDCVNY